MPKLKTLAEVCVGKTISKIEVERRGLYEGCYVTITFNDGSIVNITDDIKLIYVTEHEENIAYE